MIKGNKGEWSELYVLLYLLGTGRLYAANEKVQRLQDVYFPILKIMRDDTRGRVDYLISGETESVVEYEESRLIFTVRSGGENLLL